MSPLSARTAIVALLLLSAAGCGRRGDLERPAPLFGSAARADYEAQRAADTRGEAAAAAEADRDNDDTEDDFQRPPGAIRDPAQRLDPISDRPIDGGASTDPVGAAPSVTPN